MTASRLVSAAAALSVLASCTVLPVEGGIVVLDRDRDNQAVAASALVVADAVAQLLVAAANRCRGLDRADLRIDCLGAEYGRVAESIPEDETFAEARAAVADAGRSLRSVARINRAPGQSVAAPQGRLTPVAADRAAIAREQALGVLEQTQTVLLRSSSTLPDQDRAYGKIAAALDSGKVLMRS